MMQVKKNNLFFLIGLLILGGLSIYSYMTYNYNEKLQKTITTKDKILGDLLLKDSLRNTAQKKYSENIQKYVEECSYIVDGKEVNSQGIVKIIQKLYDEKVSKSDSIYYLRESDKSNEKYIELYRKKVIEFRDSLSLKKAILEEIEKRYQTRVRGRIEGNTIIFSTPINKLDSALAVYKYYKHKLTVKKNVFTVEIDPDNPENNKK